MGIAKSLINAGVTAYENARGLNIGGAESGRRARKKAIKKNTDRTTIGEYANRSDKKQLALGATPQFAEVTAEDIDEMISPGQKKRRAKIASARAGY
jgi:hypothetical protein